ncbi:WD domain-containing protein [Thraustotheca clavata]|uniref:WD domain-containing protein n=1 Tax=Thraustotheca clavata TaxID=74557 RepID=A0A1V9ZVZ3_9STRA|nr:WD domain-containing protein [Thraustotheca clavata]
MGGDKRALGDGDTMALAKRARPEEGLPFPRSSAIVPVDSKVVTLSSKADSTRTSNLQAPTMLLTGHGAAVYSMAFSPTGKTAATASFDRSILLWNVYGDCTNYNVLNGHKNAVLQIQYSYDGSMLVSASADKTVGLWDTETGRRMKKYKTHEGIVNGVCPVPKGPQILASASDDRTLKIWDIRLKREVNNIEERFQVTAVCFGTDSTQLFSGGVDGLVKQWDLRKIDNGPVDILTGHTEIITSLQLSPDGNFVLSNAMDSTLRKWDIRPFCEGPRCQMVYYGAKHSSDRNLIRSNWSPDMRYICSGSADRCAYIWDTTTGDLRYQLPGHTGSVNELNRHFFMVFVSLEQSLNAVDDKPFAVHVTPGSPPKPAKSISPIKTLNEQFVVFVTDKCSNESWAVRKTHRQVTSFHNDIKACVHAARCHRFACCGPLRRLAKAPPPRQTRKITFKSTQYAMDSSTAKRTMSVQEFMNEIIHATTDRDAECSALDNARSLLDTFLELGVRRQLKAHKTVESIKKNLDEMHVSSALICVNMECPVCLLGFNETCAYVELPCSHVFHRVCVEQWVCKSPTCPVCRLELNKSYE